MLAETLKALIRPAVLGYLHGDSWDAYQERTKVWAARLPDVWEASLATVDNGHATVPRDAVLTLAVTTNQMRRNHTYLRYVPQYKEKMQRAQQLCTQLQVKGLMEAADIHWVSGQPSTLEHAIDRAVTVGGVGAVQCRRCGRMLTATESVARGEGPVCCRKGVR